MYSITIMRKGKKLKFKGRPGYPGPHWLKSFMDKNSLSLKEATKLSQARYNATTTPFIICNYFNLLEKTTHELYLQNRLGLVWNCDKSELPHEPKKCKIISAKGEKNYAGISFFQKYLYQMIKITKTNKRTPSCVFSRILLAKRIYQAFPKFQKISL